MESTKTHVDLKTENFTIKEKNLHFQLMGMLQGNDFSYYSHPKNVLMGWGCSRLTQNDTWRLKKEKKNYK